MLQAQPSGILITHHGVNLLRERLTSQRVYDAYYTDQVQYRMTQAAGPVWRLRSTPREQTPVQVFPGRVPGEPSLRLYRLR